MREVQLAQHRPSPRGRCAPRRSSRTDRVGQRLVGLEVAAEKPEQRLAVVAPVLHELARQLDGVPLDVADARREVRNRPSSACAGARGRTRGRASATSSEASCNDGLSPLTRGVPIADEVGDRQPHVAGLRDVQAAAADTLVHPRAAALLGRPASTGRGRRRAISRTCFVLGCGRTGRPRCHTRCLTVGRLGYVMPNTRSAQREEAVEHASAVGSRGAAARRREREALLAQPLRPERDVPVVRASRPLAGACPRGVARRSSAMSSLRPRFERLRAQSSSSSAIDARRPTPAILRREAQSPRSSSNPRSAACSRRSSRIRSDARACCRSSPSLARLTYAR